MEFDSEIECRYRELLQPIRELAANWDVDIADSLTDYLFELEKVRITLNGGASSVNFAEAALLIQGSTAIYSKKVEYLHSLVLQSLEMISRQNSTTRKDKKGEKAGDAAEAADGKTLKASQKSKVPSWEEDDRFLFGADMDPAFLLLDDYIEQSENIDLVKKPSKEGVSYSDAARSTQMLVRSIMSHDHGAGNLRMTSCLMNMQGALVMNGIGSRGLSFGLDLDTDDAAGGNPSRGDEDGDDDAADGFPGFHFGGGDFDDSDAAAGAGPGAGGGTMDMATPMKQASGVLGPMAGTTMAQNVGLDVEASGALALMDPHDVVGGSRPVRRGRTFRVPASLQAAGDAKTATAAPSSSSSSSSKHNSSAFSRLVNGDVPLRGLMHEFLAPLQREQRRARLALARSKKQQRSDRFFFYRPEADVPAAGDDDGYWGGAGVGDDDDDDGYFAGVGAGSGAGAGAGAGAGHEGDGFAYGNNFSDDAPNEQSMYVPQLEEEDRLRQRMEKVLDEGLNSGPSPYEVLCRRHIEAFMRGADQYACETQLTRRVNEWSRRIEPLLRAQERGPAFDIYEYSDRLLSDVSDITAANNKQQQQQQQQQPPANQSAPTQDPQKVNFYQAAQGKSSSEVSRLFLACLQLANSGNVEVLQPAPYSECSSKAGEKAGGGLGTKGSKARRGRNAVVDAENIDPESARASASASASESRAVAVAGEGEGEGKGIRPAALSAVEWVNAGFHVNLLNGRRKAYDEGVRTLDLA